MKVLPQCATHSTWDSDKMMKSTKLARHGGINEVRKSVYACTSYYSFGIKKIDTTHLRPNYEAAVSFVRY